MAELGDTEDPLIGQTINGRYRVLSLIGTGGMSAVYRADHLQLGRPVAVKVLNAEMATHPEAMLRFEREALVSAKIQHPNVVGATDSGRLADGSLYLVLELVEGRSLRDLINAEGQLSLGRSLAIAEQIADALDAAHRMGIVHRDLKPSNVMLLDRDDAREFVKVLDFGMARQQEGSIAGEALTRSGRIFGTPEYMAPEQARGEKVDERADLYALGVILYELVAGRPPFAAPDLLALLIKHIHEPPPALPPEVPEPVAKLILTLLEKQPDRRLKSARQLSKTLNKLRSNPARLSQPPSQPARESSRPAHKPPSAFASARTRAVALAAAAALLFSLGVWWLWPDAAPPTPRAEPQVATAQPPAAIQAQPEPEEPAEAEAIPEPPKPDGSAELARGVELVRSKKMTEGLDAITAALDVEPELSQNKELLAAVRRAADDVKVRERALELAAKRLGPHGVDVLVDVLLSSNAKAQTIRSARKWLDTKEVRQKARPAALLALEIRGVKTCSGVRTLLPRMTEHGDQRSLAPLRRYRSTSGCGFLGLADCHRCLRGDDALEKAISRVTTRPGPSFKAPVK